MKNAALLQYLYICLYMLISTNAGAQTQLSPGDLAIIGIRCDNEDDFHFVLLTDIEEYTEIRFTDSGVMATGSFRGNEGAVKYTAPAALPAGTVLSFGDNSADFSSDGDATVGSGSISLSAAGDQLFAFQGSSLSPSFIYGLQTNSNIWQTEAESANTSVLPSSLTNALNAVAVGSGPGDLDEFDNSVYNMSVSNGTKALLLASISDNSNWNGDNSTYYPPEGSFTIEIITASEQPDQSMVSIYPVPASESLHMSDIYGYEIIEICDVIGNIILKIKHDKGSDNCTIDISELKPGTYILKLSGKGLPFTRKFIKL